ncbi:MAG: META domain-containing protein [Patescibacteria group bacterium]
MKTKEIYITVAIVVIILGIVLWTKETGRVENETLNTSTSTPTNTQGGSGPSGAGGMQKPTTSVGNQNVTKSSQAPTQESVPSIPSLSSLNGSTFRLVSYNGVPVSSYSKYTISFEETSLSAKFCNSLSGSFVLDRSLIRAGNLVGTKISCALPPNIMEIETAFVSMLNFGATIYQSGNKIILSYSPNNTVMVFTGF